jgi:hypothetical protein
VPQEICN